MYIIINIPSSRPQGCDAVAEPELRYNLYPLPMYKDNTLQDRTKYDTTMTSTNIDECNTNSVCGKTKEIHSEIHGSSEKCQI